jgi:hypothetical protein
MAKSGSITKDKAIQQVAARLDGPVSMDAFVDRVLSIWPSKAKNPQSSVRQAIRAYHLGKDLLFLDEATLLPVRIAMRGVRFRIPLSRQEVKRGWLFFHPSFLFLSRADLQLEAFRFEEMGGQAIPVNLVAVEFKEKTLFGVQKIERPAFDLGGWYKEHKVQRKDSLLATILDWEAGRFQLQAEPAREYQKHRAEIQDHNQALADLLYDALEAARHESLWGPPAVLTAYLRLKNRHAYPADHWLDILEQDPRMMWTGYEIRYTDWRSPFDAFLAPGERPTPAKPEPLTRAQAEQVYRFKASLWHRKGLWRRIAIQGGQTLADLDEILRDAFQHDRFDHLSGFWKLVRRGEGRRFREVDLGNINPYEEGEAAGVKIADLDLQPGGALKYVYDFGDWIEHRVELEGLGDPEPGLTYPHIAAQNRPRYRYCELCKEAGRKTVGAWLCITCSNREQRDVLLCDDCLASHDEDHYPVEMLY